MTARRVCEFSEEGTRRAVTMRLCVVLVDGFFFSSAEIRPDELSSQASDDFCAWEIDAAHSANYDAFSQIVAIYRVSLSRVTGNFTFFNSPLSGGLDSDRRNFGRKTIALDWIERADPWEPLDECLKSNDNVGKFVNVYLLWGEQPECGSNFEESRYFSRHLNP